MIVFGVVGLSAWNGYINGSVIVSITIGAAPVLAFVTGATLLLLFNIVTVDLPTWVFLWYLLPGIALGMLGFVLGIGLDAVIS